MSETGPATEDFISYRLAKVFPLPLSYNLVYVDLTRKTAAIWIAIDLFSFRSCSVLYSLLTVMNE